MFTSLNKRNRESEKEKEKKIGKEDKKKKQDNTRTAKLKKIFEFLAEDEVNGFVMICDQSDYKSFSDVSL